MNKNWKTTFVVTAVLLAAVQARAETANATDQTAQLQSANLFIEDGDVRGYQESLRVDTGFRINGDNLKSEFLIMDNVIKTFKAQAGLKAKMPRTLPKAFDPIVLDIADYINKIGKAGGNDNEKKNGMSNLVLAEKITRLGFCFGTDPYGIAAQIKKESTFERQRVSGTGAVGFTQMTGIAIDEVNDQLGNRGVNGTIVENIPYLREAANCYLGTGMRFVPMFESGVIPKGKTVNGVAALLKRSKSYLRSHVDSDLIYGQITLKVHLARAKKKGLAGRQAYIDAFKAYNGEPRGRAGKYATEVMTSMKTI